MRFGYWFCWLFGHRLMVPYVGAIALVTICKRCGSHRYIDTMRTNP